MSNFELKRLKITLILYLMLKFILNNKFIKYLLVTTKQKLKVTYKKLKYF